MSLPIVLLKNEERWDCHQCGFCCRGSLIPLSNKDFERLQSQQWQQQPEFRNQRLVTGFQAAESSYRLAHRADGSCIFLSEEGLCRIHSKFGLDAKPTVCRTFPLQLVAHEHQAVLTVRRACPSAAADLGSETAKHLPIVKQMVRDNRLSAETVAPPILKTGERRDWKTMRAVLESVGSLLQDVRYPPVRRLVHALQFASLLESAKTRRLSDAQIVELARTLAELAPEESKPFFTDRQEPKAYSKILFRLVAITCARLHPNCRHRATWATRLQLASSAWKAVRGKGESPTLDHYPTAQLEDLEKPFGAMSPEIYLPLKRYIESNAASLLYAIADRSSWSIVESVRGLAILFPVGLWLHHWLSSGKEPSVEDMLHVVVALDRSQGYAALSGPQHRWRLSTLSANNELERLVVWYAR